MWFLLTCPLVGTWPASQACALTGNQTSDPLVHRLALNPLSHTSQGKNSLYIIASGSLSNTYFANSVFQYVASLFIFLCLLKRKILILIKSNLLMFFFLQILLCVYYLKIFAKPKISKIFLSCVFLELL